MGTQSEQAARRTPPGPGTTVTVNASSTAAQDLTSLKGQYVIFQAKGAATTDLVYFRFGASDVGAATTNDVYLKDGEREEFFIDDAHQYFRAIASSASCSIRYASTGA